MTILPRKVPFASLLLLLAAWMDAAAFERTATKSRHLKVSHSESIAAVVQAAHARCKFKNWFILEAKIAGTKTIFDGTICEAVPAMTTKTTTSIGKGEICYVNGTDVATVLVSDEAGIIAFIAVKKGGKVNGILRREMMRASSLHRRAKEKRCISCGMFVDPTHDRHTRTFTLYLNHPGAGQNFQILYSVREFMRL
jgi:hypothetical protein